MVVFFRKFLEIEGCATVTSAWQNAGSSAKLNFSPIYPPKAVCFCFFIKFTKRLTALAQFRSELNFRSIQARTIAKPRPVSGNVKRPTKRLRQK